MSRAIVAMDTNVLLMPVEADVDPFEELDRLLGEVDLVVPAAVRRELDRLAETGTPTEVRAARVGRRLMAERCRELPPPDADADGADAVLVDLAAAGRIDYVVTNDGPLRHRVHAAGIPVISLRGQNKMTVIHP